MVVIKMSHFTLSISNDVNGESEVIVSKLFEPSQSSRNRGSRSEENTLSASDGRMFPNKLICMLERETKHFLN